MSLKIRRGTNAQRQTVIFLSGELAWATDTKKLYVGDGSTLGGIPVGSGNISMEDLTDIVFVHLTTGDIIQYDGANWINVPSSATHPKNTLLHNIDETCYYEITRSVGLVTAEIWWKTSGKTQKIREILYTRTLNLVSQIVMKQYDVSGNLYETLTISITRIGGLISSCNIVLS